MENFPINFQFSKKNKWNFIKHFEEKKLTANPGNFFQKIFFQFFFKWFLQNVALDYIIKLCQNFQVRVLFRVAKTWKQLDRYP